MILEKSTTGPELPKTVWERWNKLGDLYQTLGVPPGADFLDIDAAAAKKYGNIYFGQLAKDDAWIKSPGDIRAYAEKTFVKKYAEAHRILSDPVQRSAYDKLYNHIKESQERSRRRGHSR
jgi:curved DNA-binding protein CbpA